MGRFIVAPKQRAAYGSGAKPYKRGDGMWVARIEGGWTPQGTRKRIVVSAKTEAECKRRLKERQREIAKNGVPQAGTGRTTVKAWAEQWYPIHATKVRPNVYADDVGAIRNWIIPTIGHKKLADLTPGDLRKVREAIVGAGRSSTTAATYLRVFRKMLRDALVDGHQIQPRIFKVDLPKNAANDRDAIPLDQALAVLAAAGRRDDAARWVIGIMLGLRSGEARGLTWDRVDLDAGTIDVSWQLQRLRKNHTTPDGWEAHHLVNTSWLTRPKTSAGQRTIPLAAGTLASMRAARELWTPNPWSLVWVGANGKPVHKEDDLEMFHAIQREAGAAHPSGRPWHGHEMRHTAISMLIARGEDRSVVKQIVGQSKLVESYIHVDEKQARAAIEGLSKVLQIGD
jgi:integrase